MDNSLTGMWQHIAGGISATHAAGTDITALHATSALTAQHCHQKTVTSALPPPHYTHCHHRLHCHLCTAPTTLHALSPSTTLSPLHCHLYIATFALHCHHCHNLNFHTGKYEIFHIIKLGINYFSRRAKTRVTRWRK